MSPARKNDTEFRAHVSFTIPLELVKEMRQLRRDHGIPISRQVTDGISLYLNSQKEAKA